MTPAQRERNELAGKYTKLVWAVVDARRHRLGKQNATRIYNRSEDSQELFQAGFIGLISAAEKWVADPSLAARMRFSTFAYNHIRNHIQWEWFGTVRGVHIKRHGNRLKLDFYRARDRMRNKLGYEPSNEAVIDQMNLTPHVAKSVRGVMSIVNTETISEDLERLPGREYYEDAVNALYDREEVETVLRMLPERWATVLRLRYGLSGSPEMSQAEIGKQLGVRYQRIGQIEKAAIERIQGRTLAGVA